MTTQHIANAIETNAYDIAVEIKVANDFINRTENKVTKEIAKAVAYDTIAKLIFGGDQDERQHSEIA